MGHQSGLTRLWLVGLGHRHEPQRGQIGTSTRATTTYNRQTPLGRIGLSTRALLLRPTPPAKLNNQQYEKQPGATSHATMAPLPPCSITTRQATMSSPAIIEANCHQPRRHGIADAPLQLDGMGRYHNNAFKKVNGARGRRRRLAGRSDTAFA